ncbi:hypothetical protein [Pseudomonas mosselii]|nr:hypothetical protein [Pseudomonas mosselii]
MIAYADSRPDKVFTLIR